MSCPTRGTLAATRSELLPPAYCLVVTSPVALSLSEIRVKE